MLDGIMKMMLLCLLVALPCTLAAEEFVAPQAPRREISTQAPELNPTIDGMVKFFLSSQNLGKPSTPPRPPNMERVKQMSRRTPPPAPRTLRHPSRSLNLNGKPSDSPIAKDNHFVRN